MSRRRLLAPRPSDPFVQDFKLAENPGVRCRAIHRKRVFIFIEDQLLDVSRPQGCLGCTDGTREWPITETRWSNESATAATSFKFFSPRNTLGCRHSGRDLGLSIAQPENALKCRQDRFPSAMVTHPP